MIYFFISIIFVMLFLFWLRYYKIYFELSKSKKQLENCIERVDLIQKQIEIFRNAISEIDNKITKIEKGIRK